MTTRADPRTRLLVCDVGGVLLARGLYLLLDELAAAAGRDPAQLRAFFVDHERASLWRRSGWAEASFWAELVAVAGPVDEVGPPARWRARLRELLTPLEPGTAAVRRWSASVPVWLVTNHRRAWVEPALRASGVWQACAERLVSEETGLVKPDPAVYRAVAAAWHRTCSVEGASGDGDPGEVLCVDADPAAVAAARRAGLAAVLADERGDWVRTVDDRLAPGWAIAA